MAVEVGREAPDFELPDTDGGKTKLSDYRGKKNVLLVFYPLAFSTICTTEFCELRDVNPDLAGQDDVEVIGISVDSVWSLKAWKEKERFPNKFVADFWPHGEVAEKYGALVPERGIAKRATFLIDKEGIVRWMEMNEPRDKRDQSTWRKELGGVLKM
jgi:peroxiredoxin